jgi:hypothetical protein
MKKDSNFKSFTKQRIQTSTKLRSQFSTQAALRTVRQQHSRQKTEEGKYMYKSLVAKYKWHTPRSRRGHNIENQIVYESEDGGRQTQASRDTLL